MAGEWKEVRLGDVATIIMGQSPPGTTYNEKGRGLPFFQGVKDFSSRYPRKRVYCTAPKKIAEPGDILFSVRATIGEINRAAERCCIGRGLAAIRGNDELDTDFIEYVLRYVRHEWSILEGQGAVFGNAKKSDLEDLFVPWPSRLERHAIAHILRTLDDKIELLRRMNETLEAMARALFKSWFVDFDPVIDNALEAGNPIPKELKEKAKRRLALGDKRKPLPEHIRRLFPDRFVDSELGPIPEGWEVKYLGDITTKPQYGYTASATDIPVGPKFLRITDINKSDWIDWGTVPFCQISDEDYEKYRLTPGDILIARMADPGHGVVIEEVVDAVFASYLIRFRLLDMVYDRYIQYWLRSPKYWELVSTRKSGTTRSSINAKEIRKFPLLVPPKFIVTAFRDKVSALRRLIVCNVAEINFLAAIRDTLLPKLLSGEIRVKGVEQFLKERGL
jgi:type I restriction enzyme S subunit